MNKRGGWALIFSLFILIVFVGGMFMFFTSYKPFNEKKVIDKAISNVTKASNPIANLTVAQIEKEFNETFIYYLLGSIGAQNLHNVPFSDAFPQIKIVVEDKVYSASVSKGKVSVKAKDISNPDIIITTSKNEAAKMIKNKIYISESFKNGGSSLELVADKTTLFAKGYLSLYSEITGKTVG